MTENKEKNAKNFEGEEGASNQVILGCILAWLDFIEEKKGKVISEILKDQINCDKKIKKKNKHKN